MDWKQLLSIDEKKQSALIFSLFITLAFHFGLIIISVFTHFVVSEYIMKTIVDLNQIFIIGLIGVSASNTLQNFIEYKGQIKQLNDLQNTNTQNNEVGV